jgi:branched-chain amino acid transport system substrate-binding protein
MMGWTSSRGVRERRRLACAGLLAIVLVAAACGDDDDDDASAETAATGAVTTAADTTTETTAGSETTVAPTDDTATETTEAAVEATGTPIRIGALVDASGPASGGQANVPDVLQAWADHVNAEGGVGGHPVEFVVEDTRGDAPTGSAAAESLIADDSISAVLIVDSSGEAAYGPVLAEGGMPVIGGAGYNPTVWGALPNFFGITTSFPSVVNEQVIAAAAIDAEVVASAPCAEVPACAAAAPIFEAAAGALGIEYAGLIEIAGDAPNYTAECLEFINRGADFVQLSVPNAVALRLADECVLQGYDGWFGASAGTVQQSLYGEDIRLTGGLHGFPWFVDDEPVVHFREVMEEAGLTGAEYGQPTATAAYATMELFKKTIEANIDVLSDDALGRDEVITAYGTVADETLDGLLPGPVTFTADAPALPVSCFWLYTAEGGEITGDFEPDCPGPEFG